MKKLLRPLIVVMLALGDLTSYAGWYFEATATAHGSDSSRVNALNHKTRTWLSGDKVKVEFIESKLPAIPAGSYMVSSDGGAIIYLVNPGHQNYYLMDLAAMRGMVGGMMKILNPAIETLADEPAGSLLGMPVRRVNWRAVFDLQIAVLGMKDISHVELTHEAWIASGITDSGSTFWTGQSGFATGDKDFDAMMHAQAQKAPGLPLRHLMVSRTTDANGKVSDCQAQMELTVVREEQINDEIFELPGEFEETSFLKMQNPGGIEKAHEQAEDGTPETDTGSVLEMMEKFNQPQPE